MRSIALVGIGKWGKNYARTLDKLGVLHTLCDSNQDLLADANYGGVHKSAHFEEILTPPDIEKVILATPAPTHFSLGKAALLAGKDLLIEKPLCLSLCEAEELVQIAQQKQRILMVGHLLHYHPCIVALKRMIREGKLGSIYAVRANRLNLGTIRTVENVLWSFAPHDISLITACFGPPELVDYTEEPLSMKVWSI